MSRRLAAATVSVLLLMGGCSANKPAAPIAPAPTTVAAAPMVDAAPDPVVVAEPLPRPEALSQATTAYAEAMAQQLNRRSAKPATQPATLPSVKWLEAAHFDLALTPPQDPSGPYPVVEPAPPAAKATAPTETAPPPVPIAAPQNVAITRQPDPADDLEQRLSRQIADSPRDLAAHLEYQLLQLLRGRPAAQMGEFASLPMEEREVIDAVMDALTNFRANARSSQPMLLAGKVRPLIELADRLRVQTSLRVATVALCSRVDSFGVYEPMDPGRLAAGRFNDVIVYCEVENFSSRLNDRNLWETNLTQSAILYNEQGRQVWTDERRAVTDLARNRRHDFFLARRVRLPALPSGIYSLTVSIADQQANRIAEAGVSIQLGAESAVLNK